MTVVTVTWVTHNQCSTEKEEEDNSIGRNKSLSHWEWPCAPGAPFLGIRLQDFAIGLFNSWPVSLFNAWFRCPSSEVQLIFVLTTRHVQSPMASLVQLLQAGYTAHDLHKLIEQAANISQPTIPDLTSLPKPSDSADPQQLEATVDTAPAPIASATPVGLPMSFSELLRAGTSVTDSVKQQSATPRKGLSDLLQSIQPAQKHLVSSDRQPTNLPSADMHLVSDIQGPILPVDLDRDSTPVVEQKKNSWGSQNFQAKSQQMSFVLRVVGKICKLMAWSHLTQKWLM